MKLTWAKTDDILDSIPFKVIENCSIKFSQICSFVRACMVRAQIRGWGSDNGNSYNPSSNGSFDSLYESAHFDASFVWSFAPFTIPQTFFSVTFNFFFKKYISFVLSQYKNKAHCTYCSIGKFFCIFKWLLLLLKQCSTVSCHGPWLSAVHLVSSYRLWMKGHFRLRVLFLVGLTVLKSDTAG